MPSSSPDPLDGADFAAQKVVEDLREQVEQLKAAQYLSQFLRSESSTPESQRAQALLEEGGFPQDVVDQVEMEIRLSLRGAELSDEDMLWFGSKVLAGDWPASDDEGQGSLELSLAQRLDPSNLSTELELPALISILTRSSDRALSEIWGESALRAAYERLPVLKQALLRGQFPTAFAFAAELDQ